MTGTSDYQQPCTRDVSGSGVEDDHDTNGTRDDGRRPPNPPSFLPAAVGGDGGDDGPACELTKGDTDDTDDFFSSDDASYVGGDDDDGDGRNIRLPVRDCASDHYGAEGDDRRETKLLLSFLLMVIFGTGNTVFQKLQAVPMYNYPNYLNMLQLFVNVPWYWAYIFPVAKFGLFDNAIPPEVFRMSTRPFMIMGALDSTVYLILTFSAVHLSGPLLVLLPQAAIPISMVLSYWILGERYGTHQYVGAAMVIAGILAVLEPVVTRRNASGFICDALDKELHCVLCSEETTEDGCLSHGINALGETATSGGGLISFAGGADGSSTQFSMRVLEGLASSTSKSSNDGSLCRWVAAGSSTSDKGEMTTLVWSFVLILGCIPMSLSSIYKTMMLGEGSGKNLDPLFLNGWVSLYQLLFGLLLAVPAAMTASPPIYPVDLPKNIRDGMRCYVGTGTIEGGCHPDDDCPDSPLYVNIFLIFNVGFNVLVIYLLKYGSANILFLAFTVSVPLGNLLFALPFVPTAAPMHFLDIVGLTIILLGLVLYQFGERVTACAVARPDDHRSRGCWPAIRCLWRRCRTLDDGCFISQDDPAHYGVILIEDSLAPATGRLLPANHADI